MREKIEINIKFRLENNLSKKTREYMVEVKVKCTLVEALRLCTGRTAHTGNRGIVKVKCTLVHALRLCTGRTTHRGIRGAGKVKVHPCSGTEALYRPYGL